MDNLTRLNNKILQLDKIFAIQGKCLSINGIDISLSAKEINAFKRLITKYRGDSLHLLRYEEIKAKK
jgi:hypothetical protein